MRTMLTSMRVQKLNDPSSHQPTDSPSTSSSTKPRRSKADRASAIVPVRRSGSSSVLSSSKAGKRTAALDAQEGEDEGGKKRRKTEDEDELRAGGLRCDDDSGATDGKSGKKQGGFARPAGFEGVKKGDAAKGKGRARQGDLMDAEGSFKWAKKGEMREWDEGKGDSSEGEDEDLLDMSGDDTGTDEDEEDASEVEEMLVQASASKQDKQRQGKTRQERDKRRQEVERAVEREEARRQFGGAGGSKKANSRR